MSLLLDALKKAESEKKKSSGDSAPSHDALQVTESGTDNPETDNESLELELELDAAPASGQAEDIFPEVDEDTINQQLENQTQDEIASAENASVNTAAPESTSLEDSPLHIDTETTGTKKIDTRQIDNKIIDNKNIDSKNIDSKNIDNEQTNNRQADNNTIDPTQDAATDSPANHTAATISNDTTTDVAPAMPDNGQAEQTPPSAEANTKNPAFSRIESEKALSALINKTNQYQRNENLKRNITIIVLILLILIGSALYYYIETSTTSQSLYLAQNNQASIDRSHSGINTQSTRPVVVAQDKQPEVRSNPKIEKPEADVAISKAPATIKTVQERTTKAIKKQPPKQTLNIIHSSKADPIDALLQQAYQAFQRGDLQTSESLYSQVLQREQNNRDALLGLSAIAMKQQRYEYARQKYQALLKLNPRDSIAIAGINSIESRADPQLSESQLKFMLKQQPDASHLYFALGSLYAKQQRWAEAQSAYFSAWSADSENADYAFNLAVSLDHMNKQKQALEFYQRSLQLLATSNANFSAQQAEARIATLKPRFQ